MLNCHSVLCEWEVTDQEPHCTCMRHYGFTLDALSIFHNV